MTAQLSELIAKTENSNSLLSEDESKKKIPPQIKMNPKRAASAAAAAAIIKRTINPIKDDHQEQKQQNPITRKQRQSIASVP